MSTCPLSLILTLSISTVLYSDDIHCGPSSCQGTQQCKEGEDCSIQCNGEHSCHFATLLCPKHYKCEVTCNNSFACSNATINALHSSELLIIDGCTDSNKCTSLHIHCPPHNTHNDTAKKCKISGNDNIRNGVHYYAIHGFADIQFDYSGHDAPHSGTVFCLSDYSHSCSIANHSFTCDPRGDTTCNQGLPFISTTDYVSTPWPPVHPDPSDNTVHILPEFGSIRVFGVNINVLWCIIAGLIALILCIGCGLIYVIRQSHRNKEELKQRSARMMQLSKVKTLSFDPDDTDETTEKVSAPEATVTLASVPELTFTPTQTQSPHSKQTISNTKSNTQSSAQPRKYAPKRVISPNMTNTNQINRQRPYSFAASHGPHFDNHSTSSSQRRQMHHVPPRHDTNSFKSNVMRSTSPPAIQSRQSRSQTYSNPPPARSVYTNTPQPQPHRIHNMETPPQQRSVYSNTSQSQTHSNPPPSHIPQPQPHRIHNIETSSQSNSHTHSIHTQPSIQTNSTQLIQKQMHHSAAQPKYAPTNAPPLPQYPQRNAMHVQPPPAAPFKMNPAGLNKQRSALSDGTDSDSEHSDKSSDSSSSGSSSCSSSSSDDNKPSTVTKMRIKVEEIPIQNAMQYLKEQKNLGIPGSNLAVAGSAMTLDPPRHCIDVAVMEKKNKIPLQHAMQYLKEQKNLGVNASNMAVAGSSMVFDQEPDTPSDSDEDDTDNIGLPVLGDPDTARTTIVHQNAEDTSDSSFVPETQYANSEEHIH